jgi:hypothetical protein
MRYIEKKNKGEMSMANEFEYGSPSETEKMRQEIQKLKADREVIVKALNEIRSGKGWPTYSLNDHAEQALKSIGEIE